MGDYVSWKCSDDSQLDTLEGDGKRDGAHPHGFEPTNNGGGDNINGDGWDADGTTIVNQ